MNQAYKDQVALLVEALPFIARESCFALKGGTAINLFYREMPRLSVDIDLTYLHFDDRPSARSNIEAALARISSDLRDSGMSTVTQGVEEKKLIVSNGHASIKIEPNYTLRGYVFEPSVVSISATAEREFGYAEANVLSKPDLYGGKLCAALDRQHPRDLFDMVGLLDSGDTVDHLMDGFIAMMLSHNRPIHELLDPLAKDQSGTLEKEFSGMTDTEFTYRHHCAAFARILEFLSSRIAPYADFLIDFVLLRADLASSPIPNLDRLPAVRWKLDNLRRLQTENERMFALQGERLISVLEKLTK